MEAVNKQEIDVLITSAGITIFQAASVAYTDKQHSINVTTINVTTINQISVKVYGGTFSSEKKQHVIAIYRPACLHETQHEDLKHEACAKPLHISCVPILVQQRVLVLTLVSDVVHTVVYHAYDILLITI
jgi:hypothetical protein